MVDCRQVGATGDRVCRDCRPIRATTSMRGQAPPSDPTNLDAKVLHEASPQRITVVLGALVRTRRSTALPKREADGAHNPIGRLSRSQQSLTNTILPRAGMKMEDTVFNDLPLLLAVPRAAQLLGISRAAAYRLAASGDLPVRRLGGRVYVVTADLRDLAS
jgi:hypothetical protein